MRLEAVTECEHGESEGHVQDGWDSRGENGKPPEGKFPNHYCSGGSRRVASTTDLIEALKGLGAIEAESRHLLMEVIMSWKPGRYLVFSLEGEK